MKKDTKRDKIITENVKFQKGRLSNQYSTFICTCVIKGYLAIMGRCMSHGGVNVYFYIVPFHYMVSQTFQPFLNNNASNLKIIEGYTYLSTSLTCSVLPLMCIFPPLGKKQFLTWIARSSLKAFLLYGLHATRLRF